ncbi:MAG: hypothetical protein J6R40_05350, partial [Clostridia bacterium]|nr:hypothetical protein [Clostridia bacterium]
MKQRLFAFVLCFAMVLSMCTFLSFGAAAEEMEASTTASVWDGSTAEPSGTGTKDDPVIIASAANFAYWRANDEELYLDAYIELHTDIDLANRNWGGMNFKGHFDGKGHTIYNLKQSAATHSGLFLY